MVIISYLNKEGKRKFLVVSRNYCFDNKRWIEIECLCFQSFYVSVVLGGLPQKTFRE